MKPQKVWINGKFFDSDNAKVSVFDRGFLYGDGVFETMRSYAGVVFKLDEHLDRLYKSLSVVKIKLPYRKRQLKDAIYRSLQVNALKSAYIRLTVTRGEGRFSIDYKDDFKPNVVIVAKEFGEYPEDMYARGISAKVSKIRHNEYSPVSKIKSLNFLNYILARLDAKAQGFDEAILANTKGHITEGATTNIFLVKDEALMTPPPESGIIPGVTREVILKIARKLRLKIREREVSYKDLLNSDEVFLTNSLVEVLPVTRIDSKKIARAKPGDTTRLIHISYQKEVIRRTLL